MIGELAEFTWTVPLNGFAWQFRYVAQVDNPKRIRVLTDETDIPTPHRVRAYKPLEHSTGLFRTFAETQPSEAGILGFANKYGALGGICRQPIALKEQNHQLTGMGFGEPLTLWKHEIAEARRLVLVWDAVQKPDVRGLSNFIHWNHDGSAVHFEDGVSFELIASANFRPYALESFRPGDTITPAHWYLQSRLNEKLTKHDVVARLLWDSKRTQLSLRIVPSSLIGCIWLQFAKAVEGNKEYRQCENCKLWFEIGGSRVARSDKRFCSPTCKAAANRKKKSSVEREANQVKK